MKTNTSGKVNYKELAELFDVLSNPIRLQIIDLLKDKPHTLHELTEKIKLKKPNIAQHLTVLRLTKMVKVEKAVYTLVNKEVAKYLKE